MTQDPMGDLSIKPSRDELAQRQSNRKPTRSTKSSPQTPGPRMPPSMPASQGGLWSVIIVLAVFLAGGGAFLWGQIQDMQVRLDSSLQSLSQAESALSSLQQSLENRDKTLSKSGDQIAADIKLLDTEVRKLWDLSNKRNKVNIAKLEKQVEKLQGEMSGSGGKVAAVGKDVAQAQKELQNLKESVLVVRNTVDSHQGELKKLQSLAENAGSFEDRITTLEVAIKAIDTHRRQINGRLDKVNKDLWELQKAIPAEVKAP